MNLRRLLNSGPAFFLTIVALGIGGTVVGTQLANEGVTPDELANASMKGCEGQNQVRVVLLTRIMGDVAGRLEEMVQSATLDLAIFPGSPTDRLVAELRDGIRIDASRIEFYASQIPGTDLADCVQRYSG